MQHVLLAQVGRLTHSVYIMQGDTVHGEGIPKPSIHSQPAVKHHVGVGSVDFESSIAVQLWCCKWATKPCSCHSTWSFRVIPWQIPEGSQLCCMLMTCFKEFAVQAVLERFDFSQALQELEPLLDVYLSFEVNATCDLMQLSRCLIHETAGIPTAPCIIFTLDYRVSIFHPFFFPSCLIISCLESFLLRFETRAAQFICL